MKKQISLLNNTTTFSSEEFNQNIDTSFNELGVVPLSEQIESQPTVDEFFTLYNELFYSIPEEGETNSHEYLIQQSSEYINFNPNQDEIIALQNEIAELRKELLESQTQFVNLQISSSIPQ